MKKSTYYRNGYRLKDFLRGKTMDESINLVTELICSHTRVFPKVMAFIESQHPSDEYQATYFMDTIIKLVALPDEEADRFARQKRSSQGYTRMCKLAHTIRIMLNEEEELL